MEIDLNKPPVTQAQIDIAKKSFSHSIYVAIIFYIFAFYVFFEDSYKLVQPDSIKASYASHFFEYMSHLIFFFLSLIPAFLFTRKAVADIQYKLQLQTASQDSYNKIKQAMQMPEVQSYVDAVINQGRGLTYLEIFTIQEYRANYKVA